MNDVGTAPDFSPDIDAEVKLLNATAPAIKTIDSGK
jgi:hypothetical protein